MDFIEFLRRFYSEHQIFKILLSINKRIGYWLNCVEMMCEIENMERFAEVFTPPKAKLDTIHDALAQTHHAIVKYSKEMDFSYTPLHLAACVLWEGKYQFVLPQTLTELFNRFVQLSNFLYTYISKVFQGECVIYGVKIDGVLRYDIERAMSFMELQSIF